MFAFPSSFQQQLPCQSCLPGRCSPQSEYKQHFYYIELQYPAVHTAHVHQYTQGGGDVSPVTSPSLPPPFSLQGGLVEIEAIAALGPLSDS